MPAYFVTSCGTDIGKTFVTTALCWHFRRIGRSVQAIKPVVSGFRHDAIEDSDTAKIVKSLGWDLTGENLTKVSPWRLEYPRAPNVAARMAGVYLDYSEILGFCADNCKSTAEYVLIEGVGGVMSPLTDGKSCIDLIRDLDTEVILVVGSYLGSISHTLTALEVLKGTRVKVIVSLRDGEDYIYHDLVEYVGTYAGGCPTYVQDYIANGNGESWKYTSADIVHFVQKEP